MIKRILQYNIECLKCGEIKPTMVRIGAFCMCQECTDVEFPTDIDTENPEEYNQYIKWYEQYKEKHSV